MTAEGMSAYHNIAFGKATDKAQLNSFFDCTFTDLYELPLRSNVGREWLCGFTNLIAYILRNVFGNTKKILVITKKL